VLFVGILEPKKNLDRLLDAFALLCHMPSIDKGIQLVIAGDKGWAYEHLHQHSKNLHIEQHVVFTGYLPEEDLVALYEGAEVFVFPSIYEGFGLPVIEAMTYGIPVVTSQRSSLPEIAGEAGILVDPEKPEAIRDGIAAVLLNTEKADVMREKGWQQARKFSWRRTAEQTYQAYQDAYSL
jgi:glycosyltransferase involved in cell wall biosynthesis